MHKVFLSLGSNMSDKVDNLRRAVNILKNSNSIHNVKQSSFYETDPVGYLDQDCFVNIAVKLETELNSYELLGLCHDIEEKLHRKRIIRWGPRTIDVDIIYFDNIISDDEVLILPHPRASERAFVLIPIYELDKNLVIIDKTIEELIGSIDTDGVRVIQEE